MLPPDNRPLPTDDVAPEFPENRSAADESDARLQADEDFRRAIPAQVFLNHFSALSLHLKNAQPDEAAPLPRLLKFRPKLRPDTEATVKRLLGNAWSTEYALRQAASQRDDPFASNTLYWTFPQAFYSVFFSLRAFACLRGLTVSEDETTLRRFTGRLVSTGYYPAALSFYADGDYNQPSLHGLPYGRHTPERLATPSAERDAQAQLGQFLRATRRLQFTQLRESNQANPGLALRNARTGAILTRFGAGDWRKLTPLLGPTTFYDLLARLRISDNYREVERYVEADIDFQLFHQSLVQVVETLNGVHETYVARALGPAVYREYLKSLRPYLRQAASERFEEYIGTILQA
ncbi:MAG: hypothetical protein LH606_18300 [Cytophagaceae bacterium]|nr:hypothetical protein [Cytophagaceae bacterium]